MMEKIMALTNKNFNAVWIISVKFKWLIYTYICIYYLDLKSDEERRKINKWDKINFSKEQEIKFVSRKGKLQE